jgi:hypothetical protein
MSRDRCARCPELRHADRPQVIGDTITVVGEVECFGQLRGWMEDSPTMMRAECARVGQRVWFPRPLWSYADAFEDLHPWSTAVRVDNLSDLYRWSVEEAASESGRAWPVRAPHTLAAPPCPVCRVPEAA